MPDNGLEKALEAGDVNPTIPFRFDPCDADTGCGATMVDEAPVVKVEGAAAGGGTANWLADGCVEGVVADWKSSKSSSSAGFLPAAVDVVSPSSPKSTRSGSGSFLGSGFFAASRRAAAGALLAVRRTAAGVVVIGSTSSSSYSSNRLLLG